MKEATDALSQELRAIQKQVIGLFRPRFYPTDQYVPVIREKGGVLTCVEIGTLLGLSTLVIGVTEGRYVPFPKRKPATTVSGNRIPDEELERLGVYQEPQLTLADMMKDPVGFQKWYKENVYS